ncbi:uncharacterized protein V1516DRAFT_667638, partial [Lipomyces oligophaga]|uniref:uncharacterized protein n=1 Tax=Lipomyces oligophaga TaxID=45792 RepID=UPI0034CD39A5
MHSVKRVRTSAEAQASRKRKEAVKIVEYRGLVDQIVKARNNKDYSHEALTLTTTLLRQNPEYYTIWNYRREILTTQYEMILDKDQVQAQLKSELEFLFSRLREFPKCYWIWNHRQWCLQVSPKPDWKFELGLVTKMLEYDARNFHGWHYRRYVVAQLESATGKSLARQEFDYTTTKINSNFSNFSAWHNRTKLIPRLLKKEPSLDAVELLGQELNLITQAIYTDPDDQSVWLYHRWLVATDGIIHLDIESRSSLVEKEIKSIEDLLSVEPNSKWCLQSLAFYKEYLSKLTGSKVDESVKEYLSKLESIDPMRRNRYRDLRNEL